jgi:hypothetical protein
MAVGREGVRDLSPLFVRDWSSPIAGSQSSALEGMMVGEEEVRDLFPLLGRDWIVAGV